MNGVASFPIGPSQCSVPCCLYETVERNAVIWGNGVSGFELDAEPGTTIKNEGRRGYGFDESYRYRFGSRSVRVRQQRNKLVAPVP